MRINNLYAYLYCVIQLNIMKARLNITIEEDILKNVKYLAEAQNTSVSELVETYFKNILKKKKTKTLSQLIKELPKPNLEKNFNWKEEYYKAKIKKYGL
jgi:transcriptional regulator of NAD metabolism